MARVLFIFIDGLGIPPGAGLQNTILFSKSQKDFPWEPPGEGLAISADARLGLPGLPQSATGQTTLLTGVNASAIMGRHMSGFPGPTLRKLIEEKGLFTRLMDKGVPREGMCFANAFRPEFFLNPPRRVSASTYHATSAGIPLAKLEDLQQGRALYHDFTNGFLIKQGYNLPPFTPSQAGKILASLASNHTFTLYEYFLTDLAGHKRDKGMALSILKGLEEMILTLLDHLPLEETTLLVASDHGNIEDLERSPHTWNPVPIMAWGRGKEKLMRVRSIQDVSLMVEDLLVSPAVT